MRVKLSLVIVRTAPSHRDPVPLYSHPFLHPPSCAPLGPRRCGDRQTLLALLCFAPWESRGEGLASKQEDGEGVEKRAETSLRFLPSGRASISRDPFYDMLATRKRRIANKKSH